MRTSRSVVFMIALAVGACADAGGPPRARFALEDIDGRQVPAVVDSTHQAVTVLGDTITLFDGGVGERVIWARWPGEAALRSHTEITYEEVGSTIHLNMGCNDVYSNDFDLKAGAGDIRTRASCLPSEVTGRRDGDVLILEWQYQRGPVVTTRHQFRYRSH